MMETNNQGSSDEKIGRSSIIDDKDIETGQAPSSESATTRSPNSSRYLPVWITINVLATVAIVSLLTSLNPMLQGEYQHDPHPAPKQFAG
jgi:hypothetical protein